MCVKELHDTLSKNFMLYQKAHNYHWNVVGPDFIQFHSFFGDLYSDVYDQIDVIAEHIRAEGALVDFSGEKVDVVNSTSSHDLIIDLIAANNALINSLETAFAAAQTSSNQGLMNYIADRLDKHAKHKWQLKSIAGIVPVQPESKKVAESSIVEINGFKVIMEDGLYMGFVTESGSTVVAKEGKQTLAELVESLSKKE